MYECDICNKECETIEKFNSHRKRCEKRQTGGKTDTDAYKSDKSSVARSVAGSVARSTISVRTLKKPEPIKKRTVDVSDVENYNNPRIKTVSEQQRNLDKMKYDIKDQKLENQKINSFYLDQLHSLQLSRDSLQKEVLDLREDLLREKEKYMEKINKMKDTLQKQTLENNLSNSKKWDKTVEKLKSELEVLLSDKNELELKFQEKESYYERELRDKEEQFQKYRALISKEREDHQRNRQILLEENHKYKQTLDRQKNEEINQILEDKKNILALTEKNISQLNSQIQELERENKRQNASHDATIKEMFKNFDVYKEQEREKYAKEKEMHSEYLKIIENQTKEDIQRKNIEHVKNIEDLRNSLEKERKAIELSMNKVLERKIEEMKLEQLNFEREFQKREDELKNSFTAKFNKYKVETEQNISSLIKKTKEEEERLSRENGSLRDRILLLDQENIHHKNINERFKKSIDDMNKQYTDTLNKQTETNSQLLEQKNSRIKTLEHENSKNKLDLGKKIEELNSWLNKRTEEYHSLKEENEKLSTENKTLNTDLLKMKQNTANAVIELNKSRNEFMTKLNNISREQLNEKQELNNKIETYANQIQILQDSIKNIKLENANLTVAKEKVQEQIDERIKEVMDKNSEVIQRIQTENITEQSNLRRSIAELSAMNLALTNNDEEAKKIIENFSASLKAKEQELFLVKKSHDTLEKNNSHINSLYQKVGADFEEFKNLQKHRNTELLDKLEKSSAKIHKDNEKIEVLENKLRMMTENNNQLNTKLSTLTTELNSEKLKLKSNIDGMNMKLAQEKEISSDLSKQIELLKETLQQKNGVEDQNKNLLDNIDTKVAFYRHEIEMRDKHKRELEETIRKLDRELILQKEAYTKEITKKTELIDKAKQFPLEKQAELEKREKEVERKLREIQEKTENLQRNPPTRILDETLKKSRDEALNRIRIQSTELKKLETEKAEMENKHAQAQKITEEKQREIEMILNTHKELKQNFEANLNKREEYFKAELEKKEKRVSELENLLMSKVA